MSEMEECWELFHLALARNETLKSFALTLVQGRELANEVSGTLCWSDSKRNGQVILAEEAFEQMLLGKMSLYGIPVRVVT